MAKKKKTDENETSWIVKLLKGGAKTLFNGAIGAGLGALSSIGAEKRQRDAMDYQHQLNMEMYEKQFADQRKLIDEDRQYNSMSAVMQRARDAGVSPLAALGVSSGNSLSASVPSAGSSSIAQNDTAQMFGASVNALSTLRSLEKDIELKEEQRRGLEIENDNKQREYDDKHYKSLADIDLIRETVKSNQKEREIADAQLTLQREQFDFEKYIANDENQRAWLDAYRKQEQFLLDSAYLAFRNEKMREQWFLEVSERQARIGNIMASTKSMLESLELEKEKLNFEERKELQRIQESWRDYDEKVRQYDDNLQHLRDKFKYEKTRDDADRESREQVAQLQMYVQAGEKVVTEILDKFGSYFTKKMPTVTTTQTTKKGGSTFSRTVTESGTK